jgi:hypothetical protein
MDLFQFSLKSPTEKSRSGRTDKIEGFLLGFPWICFARKFARPLNPGFARGDEAAETRSTG